MSKIKGKAPNYRKTQHQKNKISMILAIGGIAIVMIALLFAIQKKPASFTPEVTGNPSIKVDKELVDLGDVKLGQPVQVAFEIKNIGDKPLKFTKPPYIELKEGC
ncbi:MAG: hypothetical protein ACYDH1_17740 [Anaerolineaceae bacterium]|nr:MAG: hypothetical protein CVU46_18540 [Chloroflexi bacterium HGW-Chloroflexi-8]